MPPRLFRLPWRSRRQIEADVDDELRFHLEARTAELVASGWAADAARAEAVREFGDVDEARAYINSVDRHIEAARRRRDWMSELRHDVVYALRKLRGAPAFTLTAVLTLALGIGANTAIFSVVHGVLLAPLPFRHPEQLVRIWSADPGSGTREGAVSAVDLDDWRAQRRAFAEMGGYWFAENGSGMDMTGDGEPQRLQTTFVEPGFFPTLGVQPAIGRLPREDEMHRGGPDHVVVLSYAFWQRQFAGSASVLGRRLTLGGEPYEVLGVMPRDFSYPADRVDVYVPYSTIPDHAIPRVRDNRVLAVVARLKDGIPLDRGRAELQAITSRLAQQYAEDRPWNAATVVPLRDAMVGTARTGLLVLLGAVAFVLLLACANLASLLLARATARERELAVRAALGAGRGRLVRQLVTESVVLSLLGGVLGLGVAAAGTRALVMIGAKQLPRAEEIGLHPAVLLFALGVSLLTGLVFGVAPAFRATAIDLQSALREGGRGNTTARGQRARHVLVIAEVAIAVVLVAGAGLMARSFVRLLHVDLGFDPTNVLVVNYSIGERHQGTPDAIPTYYAAVLDRVRAVPGVVDVGASKAIPFRGSGERREIVPEGMTLGADEERPAVNLIHVSDGYFRALGVPVIAGREFRRGDDRTAPIAFLVNEAFARKFFPGRSAVGRYVMIDTVHIPIIGVVGDVHQESVEKPAEPMMYVHTLQNPRANVSLVIRTRGAPLSYARAVRDAIWSVDRDQTITAVYTYDSALSDAVARPRFLTTLLALFGMLGLLVGGVGLYGVLAFLVSNRRQEIGVRMALGADAGAIMRSIVSRGLGLAGVGIAIGLVGAMVLTRSMQSMLFGVGATDPLTFAVVAATLLVVAALASYIPGRRASRVDPLVAMRAD